VNISFTWHDAFLKGKQATQTSLAFERAAILFNLGSLESFEGASCDRQSDDGLKKACKHFQVAAGYFEHVRNSMPEVANGMLTCDLTQSGCGLALQLMLVVNNIHTTYTTSLPSICFVQVIVFFKSLTQCLF
jgi:programmed cell death 6-interacting protein